MNIPRNIQTPYFLFEKKKIIQRYRESKKVFEDALKKKVELYYSVKCNPEKQILQLLAKEKSKFSVSSVNELKKALKIISKDKIEYYNPGMDKKEYKEVVSLGVKNITVDSENQFGFVKNKVSVRVRPVNADRTLFGTSNFGVKELKDFNKIEGINCHITSQNAKLSTWISNFRYIKKQILKWHKKGLDLKRLNLGGGFPVSYNKKTITIKEIAKVIAIEIKEVIKIYPGVKIIIEPGRFLIGDGVLVTKVKLIKENLIFVDASVYSSYMDTLNVGIKLNVRTLKKGKNKKYIIRGNSPCSLDIFNKTSIPKMKEGDYIIFENAGAYNIASDFCSLDKPETILC